jgi:hypothetical protein
VNIKGANLDNAAQHLDDEPHDQDHRKQLKGSLRELRDQPYCKKQHGDDHHEARRNSRRVKSRGRLSHGFHGL